MSLYSSQKNNVTSWDHLHGIQRNDTLTNRHNGYKTDALNSIFTSAGRVSYEQRPSGHLFHPPTEAVSYRTNQLHISLLVAAKELKDLERWKEQQRTKPINLAPMQLGGNQSEVEVRQRQQLQLIQSKYQKKLKREEYIRIKREAEEAEIQKMKAVQREKIECWSKFKRYYNLRKGKKSATEKYGSYIMHVFVDELAHFTSLIYITICTLQSLAFVCQLTGGYGHNKVLGYTQLLGFTPGMALRGMDAWVTKALVELVEVGKVNNAFLDRLQGESQPGGLQHFGGNWNMNSGYMRNICLHLAFVN
ncbi:hypothetical protein E2I00_012287 [Balaenoptera physalus]|uniref:Uncharacterized protein n=1 Tax=Balaenoptera physalus TaxID=9770 RepID=A0A6A1Q446_BALPH|nr:hypothetical protein E2I00_012287 [Balaenoptera physalus]